MVASLFKVKKLTERVGWVGIRDATKELQTHRVGWVGLMGFHWDQLAILWEYL